MPDLEFTTGPDQGPTEEALEAQLQTREQTAMSHSLDAGAQFSKYDVLDPNIAPSIESGLTTRDLDAEREAARVKAENDAYFASPEWQQREAENEAKRLAAAERESELEAIQRGWMVDNFVNADSDEDRAGIFWSTDEATKREILEQAYGHEPGQPLDEYAQADLAYLYEVYVREQREIAEANTTADRAIALVKQATASIEARNQFIAEQGLDPTSPATTARLVALEQVARDAGAPMHTLDRDGVLTALRGADNMMRQTVQSHRDAAFKQSLIDSNDTSVMGGLEVLGPNGYQPVLPRPVIAAKPIDPMRLDHAMTTGSVYESPDAIRAGVLGRDPAQAEYDAVMREGQRLKGLAADREAEIAKALGRR